MGFSAKLADEHDSNPAWADLSIGFVMPRIDLEEGTLEHVRCNTFGIGEKRAAGEAKRTVLLDETRSFYSFLGQSEFSIPGVFARILSCYWIPKIVRSLCTYPPRDFLHAVIDPRIGSAVWRGRIPGGVILVTTSGEVVYKHAESQPGDAPDWHTLQAKVLELS